VRAEGFEPPSSLEHRDLSPACRPFQHARRAVDCRPAYAVSTTGQLPKERRFDGRLKASPSEISANMCS
jgi:hypothetical protein